MYRILLNCSSGKIKPKLLVCHQSINKLHNIPNVQQAGFGKLLIVLSPFAVAGGVALYAKNDESFRKLLIANVPVLEKPLKFLVDDNKSPPISFDTVKKSITNVIDINPTKSKETKTSPDNITATKIVAPKTTDTNIPIPAPTPPPSMIISSAGKPVEKESNLASSVRKSIPEPEITVIPIQLSAAQIEKNIEVAAQKAFEGYNRAINLFKTYKSEVEKIVDESTEKMDIYVWSTLKNKTIDRDNIVADTEKLASEARQTLHKIENDLNGMDNLAAGEVDVLKRNIRNIEEHLNETKQELLKNKELAYGQEKFWNKVKSAREYYLSQIEDLFPGVNIAEKKINLSSEDLDLFLVHAYSHVLTYQKEVQKLENERETKLKRAVLSSGNDVESLTQEIAADKLEKQKRHLAIENQQKIFKIKAEAERELRSQLKQLTSVHADHLKEALDIKESEMKRLFARELGEKLANEEASYKIELAKMLGKLKGMDDALKERAHVDKSAQKAQALWSACISLWSAVKSADSTVNWQHRIKPLANEIKAIDSAAAEGDQFVATILKTIPEEVHIRGVYTEEALKERFFNVDKCARRLAMVPEHGAKLPIFILSYIQSMFVLTQANPISEEEINDHKIDFSKLDTFDILNRAKYWLDHGNIAQSVQYMNLLNGAPKRVASEWIKEARIFLETQQAVNALLAYAESSGY